MEIRWAQGRDKGCLAQLDRHIRPAELETSIRLGRVAVAEEEGQLVGWYRYNLVWDNTPFLNMLYLLEGHRGLGYGRQMMAHWEAQMRAAGYRAAMTSAVAAEGTQAFYEKLGYHQVGGFWPVGEGFEVLLAKEL